MTNQSPTARTRLAFRHQLRTGQHLADDFENGAAALEHKFNP